jgi:hypothetical protein
LPVPKLKLYLLIVPPLLAIMSLGVGFWADKTDTEHLDREHAACLKRCNDLSTQQTEIPDPITGKRRLSEAAVACLGLNRPSVKETAAWGDGCVRGTTSDYDAYGFFAATGIGVLWAPPALWLLILAMIRSVVRTIKEASK